MPHGLDSTDFLSHIDGELQPQERVNLLSQIRANRPSDVSTPCHPSIPSTYEPRFTPLIEAELERIGKTPDRPTGTGIDVTRYEASALEAPPQTSPDSDERNPEILAQWRETLQRAYGLNTYLSGRVTNLSLLETYGKNAWLIGNSQLEEILKRLEADLVEAKRTVEEVAEGTRRNQENAKGELEGLEATWKRGVRGVVEVELAIETLRREVLRRRRAGING